MVTFLFWKVFVVIFCVVVRCQASKEGMVEGQQQEKADEAEPAGSSARHSTQSPQTSNSSSSQQAASNTASSNEGGHGAVHSSQSAPSTILLESTSKPQLAAAFHGSNSSQKPTRGGPAKKVISHKLDPDLLFRDRTGERHTQLPALSGSRHVRRSNSTSEIETSASLASLSPHRVLPDIAIGADVASGAFQEAQDERSSAQHNLAASETAEPSQHQAARPHTADAAGQRALQEERRAGRETEQPGSDETSKAHDLSTEAKAAQGQEQEKEQVKEEPGVCEVLCDAHCLFGLAWFGLVWLGLAWFGLVWFG